MQTWTAEQLGTFLESLDGDRFRGPLFLLGSTGMRRGEVLGLKWQDVRLNDAELDVRRSTVESAMLRVAGSKPRKVGLRERRPCEGLKQADAVAAAAALRSSR
jgi:integrase